MLYLVIFMRFSILSYNVYFNNAYPLLLSICRRYRPDIICLQEIACTIDNVKFFEKSNYRLAGYSTSFNKHGKIYGVATYYNFKKLKLNSNSNSYLPRSIYEWALNLTRLFRSTNKPRSALKSSFSSINNSKKKIVVINTHLSAHGTNSIRNKQLDSIFSSMSKYSKAPLIIAGDFNYPYRRRFLEKLANQYGFKEATSSLLYTFTANKKYNFIEWLVTSIILRSFLSRFFKLDYIFYKNLKHIKTERINVNYSDHFPVISHFSL